MGATRYVGEKVLRMEDPKLITGHGRYVDDIELPGTLHAAYVRSEHAHAKIGGIDTSAAKSMPGVHAVYVLADFGEPVASRRMPQPFASPAIKQNIIQYLLARDEVNFVGHAIAMVVADSRAQAEDAAARVQVDYEPLPVVVDCRDALKAGAPLVHSFADNNLMASIGTGWGEVDEALKASKHVFTTEFMQHRGGCHSMETRGVLARDEPWHEGLTIWSGTQAPHLVRANIAAFLGESEARIRVIAPDVGGGFGPKAGLYPEEVSVPLAARMLGRPVKWIEDRREHFTVTNQQGDQFWRLDIGADDDGQITALRAKVTCDMGAHANYGLLLAFTTVNPVPGPYAIPALRLDFDAVYTNTTSKSPVRGAGRPDTAYGMERAIETVARGLKLDASLVREVNFVKAEQFPYQPGHKTPAGVPITYDSGDFHGCMEKAKQLADYAGFKARQEAARKQGRYLGMGFSSCIEDTGLGPYEGSTVRVMPSGKVQILTGSPSQGQGHATTFSQIVADILGVDIEDISFASGDSEQFPIGVGTVGSRIAVAVSTSMHGAATEVREKAIRLASQILEAGEEDLDLEGGAVVVKGTDRKITLGELAARLTPFAAGAVPQGFTPALEATSFNKTKAPPTASGTNIAEVEVDIGTGDVRVLRYTVAHDCGRVINPMLVDGQIIGGVVHGIGNALFERMHYDASGQPLSTNYGEYLLPLATEMPHIDIVHQETLSPWNPLGVKGAGEGGTIPAANAIIAAIENALAPFGVVVNDYPVDPQRICQLIDRAQSGAQAAG